MVHSAGACQLIPVLKNHQNVPLDENDTERYGDPVQPLLLHMQINNVEMQSCRRRLEPSATLQTLATLYKLAGASIA